MLGGVFDPWVSSSRSKNQWRHTISPTPKSFESLDAPQPPATFQLSTINLGTSSRISFNSFSFYLSVERILSPFARNFYLFLFLSQSSFLRISFLSCRYCLSKCSIFIYHFFSINFFFFSFICYESVFPFFSFVNKEYLLFLLCVCVREREMVLVNTDAGSILFLLVFRAFLSILHSARYPSCSLHPFALLRLLPQASFSCPLLASYTLLEAGYMACTTRLPNPPQSIPHSKEYLWKLIFKTTSQF